MVAITGADYEAICPIMKQVLKQSIENSYFEYALIIWLMLSVIFEYCS